MSLTKVKAGKAYKVKGMPRFVEAIATYSNGWETTGGLYTEDQLESVPDDVVVVGITYDSSHAVELPIDWDLMLFIDDNNKMQRIKMLHLDSQTAAYEMEDGSFSQEVTF